MNEDPVENLKDAIESEYKKLEKDSGGLIKVNSNSLKEQVGRLYWNSFHKLGSIEPICYEQRWEKTSFDERIRLASFYDILTENEGVSPYAVIFDDLLLLDKKLDDVDQLIRKRLISLEIYGITHNNPVLVPLKIKLIIARQYFGKFDTARMDEYRNDPRFLLLSPVGQQFLLGLYERFRKRVGDDNSAVFILKDELDEWAKNDKERLKVLENSRALHKLLFGDIDTLAMIDTMDAIYDIYDWLKDKSVRIKSTQAIAVVDKAYDRVLKYAILYNNRDRYLNLYRVHNSQQKKEENKREPLIKVSEEWNTLDGSIKDIFKNILDYKFSKADDKEVGEMLLNVMREATAFERDDIHKNGGLKMDEKLIVSLFGQKIFDYYNEKSRKEALSKNVAGHTLGSNSDISFNFKRLLGTTYTQYNPHFGTDLGFFINGVNITMFHPVVAIESGVVSRIDFSTSQIEGAGNKITVSHIDSGGRGYVRTYQHLNHIYVKTNARITAGDIIGLAGNLGKSTGPHLHTDKYYSHFITAACSGYRDFVEKEWTEGRPRFCVDPLNNATSTVPADKIDFIVLVSNREVSVRKNGDAVEIKVDKKWVKMEENDSPLKKLNYR